MKKEHKSKPHNPDNIRAIPVFRDKPDTAKLGRAVIALSENLTSKESEAKNEKAS